MLVSQQFNHLQCHYKGCLWSSWLHSLWEKQMQSLPSGSKLLLKINNAVNSGTWICLKVELDEKNLELLSLFLRSNASIHYLKLKLKEKEIAPFYATELNIPGERKLTKISEDDGYNEPLVKYKRIFIVADEFPEKIEKDTLYLLKIFESKDRAKLMTYSLMEGPKNLTSRVYITLIREKIFNYLDSKNLIAISPVEQGEFFLKLYRKIMRRL